MRNSSSGAVSIEGRRRAVDRMTYAILIAGALVMVFPFFWMLGHLFQGHGRGADVAAQASCRSNGISRITVTSGRNTRWRSSSGTGSSSPV